MTERKLDKPYMYRGRIYGPGTVQLDDDVDRALAQRGAFDRSDVDESVDSRNNDSDVITLTGALSDDQITALVNAGYTTDESVAAATDDELLAVQGIGRRTVMRLRGSDASETSDE